VLIKPITVRIVAYGQPANLAAIQKRAVELLKEEHGKVPPAAIAEIAASDAHAEIVAKRWDDEAALKEPTGSQRGLLVTLTDVHERMTTEWLYELPVAKTCVAFATWTSSREPTSWQLLAAQGRHWSESRPVA
jgi:hypothetical protein